MLITYIRSSSGFGCWNMCEQKYFLEYTLGLPTVSGHKADLGTTTHRVLECLARIKKQIQETNPSGIVKFCDEEIGLETEFHIDDFLRPYQLSNKEVEFINKTRINKYTYKHPCKLEYGHTRHGVELVEELIEKCFEYYKEKNPHHDWKPVNFKDVTNWVWMSLDGQNGLFDPRRREIVDAEPHFDIEIDRPWAEYDYKLPNGERLQGKLHIKGTIDLITKIDDSTYEIVDHKSGQRLDWATGQKKDFKKLSKDPQLLLYYYAAKHMYPDIDHIILSINFIRDGGPFSMCFDWEHMEKMEKLLKERFEEIKACELPKMQDPTQKNFKCTKLCDFYKTQIEGENTCKHIHNHIKTYGINSAVEKFQNKDFSINDYSAPG